MHHADTGGERQRNRSDVGGNRRVFDLLGQALQRADGFTGIAIVQKKQEFLAAPARHPIAIAQSGHQALGHAFQYLIAGSLAVTFIDVSKMIEIDHRQRKFALLTHHTCEFLLQMVFGCAPVGQVGQ